MSQSNESALLLEKLNRQDAKGRQVQNGFHHRNPAWRSRRLGGSLFPSGELVAILTASAKTAKRLSK
jgi:hypothetical protein